MNCKTENNRHIAVQDNAKERVAFDLMNKIASYDAREKTESIDRKYWLTLYHQCLKATSSSSQLESVLREE